MASLGGLVLRTKNFIQLASLSQFPILELNYRIALFLPHTENVFRLQPPNFSSPANTHNFLHFHTSLSKKNPHPKEKGTE